MTDFESYVSEQIKLLVPKYDVIELDAAISTKSVSVDFFATVDGRKMQCFQMIDEGLFSEKLFRAVAKAVAAYARTLPDFKQDSINHYNIVLK